MVKAFIVDDEQNSISSISLILKEYCPEVDVVGTATSMKEALVEITKKKPNLLILDIEMPFGSGFDLLENLSNRDFETIFITAYNNYAIKAFKYSATDYILKPIDIDEFISAISRASEKINKNEPTQPGYSVLFENLKTKNPTKIAINNNDGITFIAIQDILRIEGEGSYTRIHLLSNKKILVSKNLKDFQNLLSDHSFFRSHNSHLINLEYVSCFHHKDGGSIEMTDGSLVPLARRKKEEFLAIMSQFSR